MAEPNHPPGKGTIAELETALQHEQAARIQAQAEARRLATSESDWRRLLEAVPLGVWVCDPDGNLRYANPWVLEQLGLSLGELQQLGWMQLLAPEDAQAAHQQWLRSAAAGKEWEAEHTLHDRHGQARFVLSCAWPVRDTAGRISDWVGIGLDITDRKHLERRLHESEQQARSLVAQVEQDKQRSEAANQAKDQFLAVLSHELRTPLTPVLAIATALEMQPELPAAIREDIQTIRRNVELEVNLIDDLLDVTRITRGKIELHRKVVDVHALLRAGLEICQGEVEAKKLEVVMALRAEHHHVLGDPARLQQVFWNLIKNAIKFTPERGRIGLHSGDEPPGWIVLEVQDTGVGIKPENLPHIFDPFEQGGQTVTRRYGGLGLGLMICRSLLQMHEGTISAFSEGEGKGAAFTIRLPTVRPLAEQPTAPPPSPPQQAQTLRILLVDDHPDTLRIMARLLSALGHEVQAAATVREAVERAAQHPLDLLISDLSLPDGSGLDLMRQLRQQYGLPGIALSGYGAEEDVRSSAEAGFAAHLTKPVNIQALQELLQRFAR